MVFVEQPLTKSVNRLKSSSTTLDLGLPPRPSLEIVSKEAERQKKVKVLSICYVNCSLKNRVVTNSFAGSLSR